MTRFIYLADSHYGANPLGYQQQRGYPERLREIVDALREYLAREKDIAFVLHGGDMIDATTDDNIRAAAKLFDLDVPVYLCLGNHDLTTLDALQRWLRLAPHLFPGGQPEYSVSTEDCLIHVVPNHWEARPYYWESLQETHLRPKQFDFLKTALASSPDRPHLLLTHGPVFGLPPEQTGLAAPYHAPNAGFTNAISSLATEYPHLRCVLGAHNHLNMCVAHGGAHFVTASAFVETPFEIKLFEVAAGTISMLTITLADRMNVIGAYDFNKTFVQGRAVDRSLRA
jgi:DNA repair exonuclease SbcCD nuclease subunit